MPEYIKTDITCQRPWTGLRQRKWLASRVKYVPRLIHLGGVSIAERCSRHRSLHDYEFAKHRECITVKRDPGWTLETPSAFAAIVPGIVYDQASRTYSLDCLGKRTVYRVYNNRFASNDSNHRYISDPALYQSMQVAGWKGEGIQFCELP